MYVFNCSRYDSVMVYPVWFLSLPYVLFKTFRLGMEQSLDYRHVLIKFETTAI